MTSILNFIKNLPEISKDDVINDINYIRKSSVLVNEALSKGSDVMQMPGGDIHITETKVVTYKYIWNAEKGKFERATSGIRAQRKKRRKTNDDVTEIHEQKIAQLA
tara:strand:+ start:334 stop:651 length:318 start_codon:yes stop_codon:yes gene_type:complete